MSASSTVKPHMKIAGRSAASAPAISHLARSPFPGMHVEKYVLEPARSYDSIPSAPPPRLDRDRNDRMRFEIVVAPHPADTDALPPVQAPPPTSGVHLLRSDRRRPARAVLDVFIDGANVTARVRETHGALVLRDLAIALIDLAARPRGKIS